MTHQNGRTKLSRRRFLELSSLATGGVMLRSALLGSAAEAATAPPNLLLMVYFDGGWDQLLALDPRPNNLPQYRRGGSTGIVPAYEDSASKDSDVQAVLNATGGSGVQAPTSQLTFGPAVPQSFLNHAPDFCVIRGVAMDTVTHQVGARYLLTGKFPRGLAANGSSLNTVWSSQGPAGYDLPNLVLDFESYNERLPARASPIIVTGATDVVRVLTPGNPALGATSDAALQAWEASEDSCAAHGYDATGLVSAFRGSRVQGRVLANPARANLFRFTANPAPTSPLAELYGTLGIDPMNPNPDLNGPKGQVAIAAQALGQGVSQVMTLKLVNDLDDHFDEAGSQSVKLRAGFDALGKLINYLKAKDLPGVPGTKVWDRTTVMVFSEFARTPAMNSRDGRDHHLASSCLVAGPGLQKNKVFGATSEHEMGLQRWNFATGAQFDGGNIIRPPDIHATLLRSMGLDSTHLSNQNPQLISALLKNP